MPGELYKSCDLGRSAEVLSLYIQIMIRSPLLQRRLRAATPALLLLLASSLASCSLLSSRVELSLETPSLPPSWRHLSARIHYVVTWADASGGIRETECDPGAEVFLAFPRLPNTAVLITPYLETSRGNRTLRPGAALYPQDLVGNDTLLGSWRRGFEGTLFLELQRRGYAYFQVNQPRLEAALMAQCGQDPWQADFHRVLARLLEGSFRSSYLGPRGGETGMEAVPPGRYLRDNLLLEPAETVRIEGRSILILEGVYPGIHRFFHEERGGELVVVNDGEHRLEWRLFEGP